jgi:hypothetical protein
VSPVPLLRSSRLATDVLRASLVSAVLLALAAPAHAGPVTKGPYLQGLGPTGVTIKIELASAAAASVEVTPEGADTGRPSDGGAPDAGGPTTVRRESTEARAFHTLRVDGLEPATRYQYRVTAGGAPGEVGHFTTAPIDPRPFRFLAYGDSRSDAEAHALVVRAMQATPSDFLVNTGDMVEIGTEPRQWADFFAVEGHMLRDRCAFVAVGNHELARGDKAGEVAFLRYFAAVEDGHDVERLYGTFRWSNTRFFVLNAMDRWTGDERAWLKSELGRALREPGIVHRVAVMHWGPFSSGPHGGNPALASGEVIGIMRDGKVDLVVAGHDHAYERGEGGGVKYVITGGAGAPLYPKKHEAAETRRFESAYHFVEVAIDGDRVDVTAHRTTGGILEACGFRGAGGWECDASSPPPAKPSGPPASPPAASTCACALPGARRDAAGGAAALFVAAAAVGGGRRRRRV